MTCMYDLGLISKYIENPLIIKTKSRSKGWVTEREEWFYIMRETQTKADEAHDMLIAQQ